MLDTCEFLASKGAEITYLNVNSKGFIDLDELRDRIRKDTILISVMAVNNETRVIQPVEEIAQIAQKNSVFFLSDITQAIGKIPLDINKLGIDFVVWSAHKIYGMKGVGAVYIKRKSPRIKLMPLIHGGGHERGIRSGTLNVPAIFVFGEASEIASKNLEKDSIRIGELRDFLEKELLKIPNTTINGDTTKRLYNVTNIRFEGIDSEALLMGINSQICASNGSACTSASMNPSHVLMAMGLSEDESFSSIRFSLGRYNTIEEVEESAKFITEVVEKLRAI
jgi:cysteine desulfurase